MNFLSMFSGIDAASVAWMPLGWKAAAFCEIEPFPSAVLAHHYPNVPNLGDVTKADFDAIGPIDLAVFGSPCQSYSVAGKRLGLDDPRGNLALVAGRIIYRKRPRWFTFENVPGLLSSDGGWDFGTILAAFAGYPSGSVFAPPTDGWGNAGVIVQANANSYGLAWRVLDAQYFGVPQRRRRVFVVGHLGDWRRAAAVLFERHSLSGHPAPRREKGARAASSASCGFEVGGTLGPRVSRLTTDECANGAAIVAHSLRAEGFDASEDGTGRGTPLVPVAIQSVNTPREKKQNGIGVRDDGAMYSLTARDQHAVCFTAKDHGADASDISPTLRSGSNSGSHANGGVMPAVAFQTSGYGASVDETASTMQASYDRLSNQVYGCIEPSSAVRRLTPRECERLQGFPDDYTAVLYRGKPAADGPRYKALGNSMAVPVMAWIGERIAKVEALQSQSLAA